MTTTRAQLAQQTRRDILDSAMQIMAQKGYAQTRIEDIAEQMGVTRGAVYGHFPTKAKLYEEILRLSQEPLYELLERLLRDEDSAPQAIRRFMLAWLMLLDRDPAYRNSAEIFFNKSEMIDEVSVVYEREIKLTQDMVAGLAKVIRRGIAAGELSRGLKPRRAAIQVYAYLMGLTQSWLFNPKLFSIALNAGPMTDAFVAGMLPPRSGARRVSDALRI